MKKILLIYSPRKGSVEKIAKKIFVKFNSHDVDMFAIEDFSFTQIKEYENIIMGGSTVGAETWQNAKNNIWSSFLHQIEDLKLENIKVAIFGLGDQLHYTEHFVDDMRQPYDAFKIANATIVGEFPTDTYNFDYSKAIVNGKFIGLPIDDDIQPELTDERIEKWVNNLKNQFN